MSIQQVNAAPDNREDLDALLRQYEQRLKQASAKKEAKDFDQGRFMERFQVLARTDWARTLEEIADKLGSAGHRSSVTINQERFQESLTMKIEPNASTPFAPSEDCYIRITPNEAMMKVSFRVQKVDSLSHSGGEEMYTLEDLTPQKFRSLLVRGIAQILQSTLPKYQ